MNLHHSMHHHPVQQQHPRPLPYEVVDITSRYINNQNSVTCQSTCCITITASPTHPLPPAWAKLLPCGCALCRDCVSMVVTDKNYTCVGCGMKAEQFGPLDLKVNTFPNFKSAAVVQHTKKNQRTHSITSPPSMQNTPDLSMSVASSSATASPEIPFYTPQIHNSRVNQYEIPYLAQKGTQQDGRQSQREGYSAQIGYTAQQNQISSALYQAPQRSPEFTIPTLLPPGPPMPAIQPITYPSLRSPRERRTTTEEKAKEGEAGDRSRLASLSSTTSTSSSSISPQNQPQHERLESFAAVARAQSNASYPLLEALQKEEEKALVGLGLGLSLVPEDLSIKSEGKPREDPSTKVQDGMADGLIHAAAVENRKTGRYVVGLDSQFEKKDKKELSGKQAEESVDLDTATREQLQVDDRKSGQDILQHAQDTRSANEENEEELGKTILIYPEKEGNKTNDDEGDKEQHGLCGITTLTDSSAKHSDGKGGKQEVQSPSPYIAATSPIASLPQSVAQQEGLSAGLSAEPSGPSNAHKAETASNPLMPHQADSSPPLPSVTATRTPPKHPGPIYSSSTSEKTRTGSMNSGTSSRQKLKGYSGTGTGTTFPFSSLNKRRGSATSSSNWRNQQQSQKGLLSKAPENASTSTVIPRHERQISHNQYHDHSRQYPYPFSTASNAAEKPYFPKSRRPSLSSVASTTRRLPKVPHPQSSHEASAKASWGIDPWTDCGDAGAKSVDASDNDRSAAARAYSWSVVKITSISYHTTIADMAAFLPPDVLPSSSENIQPIHIFKDIHNPDPSPRNKTLPYAYIECASTEAALSLLRLSKEGKLGMLVGRQVQIRIATMKELLSELWPTFLKDGRTGRAVPDYAQISTAKEDLPFFTEEDKRILEEMLEPYPSPSSASSAQGKDNTTSGESAAAAVQSRDAEEPAAHGHKQRFNVYPRERPFTRLISLLTKLPVHIPGLVDRATLDRLYGCLCNAITCIANGTEGLHHARDICRGLIEAGQSCTGFSKEQQTELEYAWKSIADMEIANLSSPASRIDFSRPYLPYSHHDSNPHGSKARDRSASYSYHTRSYTINNPALSEPWRRQYNHERSSTTNDAIAPGHHNYKERQHAGYTSKPSFPCSSLVDYRTRRKSLGNLPPPQPNAQLPSIPSAMPSHKPSHTAQRDILRNRTNHARGNSNASNASSTTIKTSSSSSLPGPGSGKYKIPPRLTRNGRNDTSKAGLE